MLEIPGIDPEKVERYGKPFLEMIKNSQQLYESMMRQQEDRTQDPNHMNVINISDDEEFENHDLDEFDENDSQQERSAYFPSRDVEAFNAKGKLEACEVAGGWTDGNHSIAAAISSTSASTVSEP